MTHNLNDEVPEGMVEVFTRYITIKGTTSTRHLESKSVPSPKRASALFFWRICCHVYFRTARLQQVYCKYAKIT